MVWLKRILMGVLVFVVLFLAIGFALPSKFRVERSTEISATPADVYARIASPKAWAAWTVWNQRDPSMKIDYSGPESGVNAAWKWQSKTEGNGEMTFTAAEPGKRLTYKLFFADFGMESTGDLVLAPSATGTRITWSNAGDMGSNPINRYFGLMMDKMVGPDFEAGLARLKAQSEAAAKRV